MNIARAIEIANQSCKRGDFAEAEALFTQVLRQQPNDANILHSLGLIAYQTARFDAAIEYFHRAIASRPEMAEAHNSLANVLRSKGMTQPAMDGYRAALRYRPDYFEAHYNLGTLLREAGRTEQAIDCFRKALELQPQFVDTANDLGSALREVGRANEAVAVLKHAIGQAPDFYKAHNNLGNALRFLGRFDEAEAAIRAALKLRSDLPEIHINLGNVLREKGDLNGAVAATREAIRLRPDLADAHQNLGSHLLLAGRYLEAWPEHEWRWRCQGMPPTRAASLRPQWDGSNLEGRTILLHSDAGLGDAIHCLRYIPMVVARDGRIVVEYQAEVHRLVCGFTGVEQVLTATDPLPQFDVQCALMSLPGAFKTTIETIPSHVPYLRIDPASARKWSDNLRQFPNPRVGLVWAGNPKNTNDRRRSVGLSTLAPLSQAGNIIFHSLQLGEAAAQLHTARNLRLIDHSRELTDLSETAALVTNLDLVISVDTSVAHLAGALGKPIWIMLPFTPDWRWMLRREDSPWYPTMRLFRQTSFGDWNGVVRRMAEALKDFQRT